MCCVQASLAGKPAAAGSAGTGAGYAVSNGASNGSVKPAVANGSSAGGSAGNAGGIAAYDKLLQEQLKPFMEQAVALGGEVCCYCLLHCASADPPRPVPMRTCCGNRGCTQPKACVQLV
jgi:hypothetical protein